MLDAFFIALQRDLANLHEWWRSIDTTYRAVGCALVSFFLMWEATKSSQGNDRRFFLTGMAALGLLAYGAMLFVEKK